jgi:hypothetical protein
MQILNQNDETIKQFKTTNKEAEESVSRQAEVKFMFWEFLSLVNILSGIFTTFPIGAGEGGTS